MNNNEENKFFTSSFITGNQGGYSFKRKIDKLTMSLTPSPNKIFTSSFKEVRIQEFDDLILNPGSGVISLDTNKVTTYSGKKLSSTSNLDTDSKLCIKGKMPNFSQNCDDLINLVKKNKDSLDLSPDFRNSTPLFNLSNKKIPSFIYEKRTLSKHSTENEIEEEDKYFNEKSNSSEKKINLKPSRSLSDGKRNCFNFY